MRRLKAEVERLRREQAQLKAMSERAKQIMRRANTAADTSRRLFQQLREQRARDRDA